MRDVVGGHTLATNVQSRLAQSRPAPAPAFARRFDTMRSQVMSPKRSNEAGPEERAEELREEREDAREGVSELAGADPAEEDDGEESLDEILETDQTELEELGLTLDDPHQPGSE
jgi:hypothetical protein